MTSRFPKRGRWFFWSMLLVCIPGATLPAAAQTPDSQTPAVETVCSKLKFATPALYGLCVAYCEAHDADLDPLTMEPRAREVANKKILENYNKKKTAADPEMPCLRARCPCFSAEDLAALDFSVSGQCQTREASALTQIFGVGKEQCRTVDLAFVQDRDGLQCGYFDIAKDGEMCVIRTGTIQKVSVEEFAACRELLQVEADRRSLQCVPI